MTRIEKFIKSRRRGIYPEESIRLWSILQV